MIAITNKVALRAFAVMMAKGYAKNTKSLVANAKKIEAYVMGDAEIPNVVDNPSAMLQCFEKMLDRQKENKPLGFDESKLMKKEENII